MVLKAKYTVVLKSLMDNEESNQLIQKALSTYPLYQQAERENPLIPVYIPTREELNKKILNYYKHREIGFETFGRFLDELETAMNEIMPYYNQLYFSVDQDYDIRFNVDYERIHTEKRQGENSGDVTGTENASSTSTGSATDNSEITSETDGYNKSVSVDTPQNVLSMPSAYSDSGAGADKVHYAENVKFDNNKNKDTSSTTGTSSNSTNSESSGSNNVKTEQSHSDNIDINEKTKGNYGQITFQSLILAYRDTIINIEQQIISDERIKELFMLVY